MIQKWRNIILMTSKPFVLGRKTHLWSLQSFELPCLLLISPDKEQLPSTLYFLIAKIIIELISFFSALQMSFKVNNNLIDPTDLVLILLVIGTYSNMSELDVLSVKITQRAIDMKKAINVVWKYIASWQVNNVLNTWNKPSIVVVYGLSIHSPILVYQKKNVSQLKE